MRALHQFVPTFELGAVGGHMLELQRLAHEELGLESEVFAEYIHPSLEGRARHYAEYGRGVLAGRDDAVMYHMAIGSAVADFVRERSEPLLVDHHNITPPEFYEPWDPGVAYGCSWGRAQLPQLASRARLAIAMSSFNEEDLRRAGYGHTVVAPYLLDLDAFRTAADEDTLARLQAEKEKGGTDWLFVGRISPNKCQHDLLKAFAVYRKVYDPAARLHLVGGSASARYWSALESFARATGMQEAVDFTGGLPPGKVSAYYQVADVFVCVSEHEGFCIPLIEALSHRVPVVAFAAAAIPDTLDDAGLLLGSKQPSMVAAGAHRVVGDPGLRDQLVKAGTNRLTEFALERSRARWVEILGQVEAL